MGHALADILSKKVTLMFKSLGSLQIFFFYIYIYAFSRRFYPKRLTLHSSYSLYIFISSFLFKETFEVVKFLIMSR